jgi:CBS domain-containing protein
MLASEEGDGMLTVKEIMTKEVITVLPETDIAEAAKLLLDKGFNGVPVVDETGKLIGLLCQSDLVAQQKKFPVPSLFTLLDGVISFTSMKDIEKEVQKITAMTVADAMTPNPTTVGPDTSIEELGTIMVDKNFHTIPVVDGGELIGIVGKEDVLRTLV